VAAVCFLYENLFACGLKRNSFMLSVRWLALAAKVKNVLYCLDVLRRWMFFLASVNPNARDCLTLRNERNPKNETVP
jgi:hypothetical protein